MVRHATPPKKQHYRQITGVHYLETTRYFEPQQGMKKTIGFILNGTLYLVAILGLAGFTSVRDLYDKLIAGENVVGDLLSQFSFLLEDWRLAFLLMFLALLYHTWINAKFKSIPISVLSTNITLRFVQPDGSDVHVFRNQILRANRPNVTAYFGTLTPRPGGRIDKDSIDCDVVGENANVTSTFDALGDEDTGWEIVQKFSPRIPYTSFFPFIPNLIHFGNTAHYFDKLILRKFSECHYINDLNTEYPEFNLKALRYTHHRVLIELEFHENNIPSPDSIQAQLFGRNGVRNITPIRTPQPKVFRVEVSDLRQDRLRITWKWPDPPNG